MRSGGAVDPRSRSRGVAGTPMHTPMRLFARVRRALRRRHGAEDGFTIVEVLAAMMVLTVGIMGLAQLGTGMVVSTLRTRQRENAIAESNRQLETLRASGFAEPRFVSRSATLVGCVAHLA